MKRTNTHLSSTFSDSQNMDAVKRVEAGRGQVTHTLALLYDGA
jgi:hypothetical protein